MNIQHAHLCFVSLSHLYVSGENKKSIVFLNNEQIKNQKMKIVNFILRVFDVSLKTKIDKLTGFLLKLNQQSIYQKYKEDFTSSSPIFPLSF